MQEESEVTVCETDTNRVTAVVADTITCFRSPQQALHVCATRILSVASQSLYTQ